MIIAAIIVVLCKYLIPLLLPFVLALVVAGLLQKPIRFLNRKLPIKKRLCGLICAVLFFAVLVLASYFGGGGILSGIERVLINLPNFYVKTVGPMVADIFNNLETLQVWGNMNMTDILTDMETQIMDALAGLATSVSGKAVAFVSGVAVSLPGLFIKLVLFIIGTVFISMDYDVLLGWCLDQMNDKARNLFFEVKAYIVGTLFVVIRSYLLIMSITFIELSIALTIIGIDNSILIALCIAIFDILPVLGTGGVMIPWTVINVVLGNFKLAAGLAITYIIVTIIRNIIEPKIVGGQLGLHPIVTLSSMFAGVQMLGALGLFGFPIGLSLLCHLNNKGVISIFKKKEEMLEAAVEAPYAPDEEAADATDAATPEAGDAEANGAGGGANSANSGAKHETGAANSANSGAKHETGAANSANSGAKHETGAANFDSSGASDN